MHLRRHKSVGAKGTKYLNQIVTSTPLIFLYGKELKLYLLHL